MEIAVLAVLVLVVILAYRSDIPNPPYSATSKGTVVGSILGMIVDRPWSVVAGMLIGMLVGTAIDNYRKRACSP